MIGCIAAQKPQNKLKFVTLDKEINMNTPWRREEIQKSAARKIWQRRLR